MAETIDEQSKEKTYSRTVRRSKFNFLMSELESWKEANLITQEQLSDIRAHYEVSGSYFSKALINLGAALFGAALLSYIAANWMEFSRVTKISLILLAYVGLVLSAWITDKRSQILCRGLLLLSSFTYGGGIFLIAQIFHEGGHYTTALLLWIIGITPVCAIFKDRLQLSLIQIISVVYLFGVFESFHYDIRLFNSPLFALEFFRWETALVTGLWLLWLRARGSVNFNLNMLIVILFICLVLHASSFNESKIILILFCLGVMSGLAPCGEYKDINAWGVALVGVCGLIMTYDSFWRYGFTDLIHDHGVIAICSGILTCILMILFMLRGSAAAVFFFCAVILRYFFDKFYDFIPKSAMFAIGGIILVAVGVLVGKVRRIKRNKKLESVKGG